MSDLDPAALEEARREAGVPSDWECYSCANCGSTVWTPPKAGTAVLVVCQESCLKEMLAKHEEWGGLGEQ